MAKQFIRKLPAVILLALMGIGLAGCETTAKPAALTGQEQTPGQQERHATGIESQARDM